jgi:Protein of unknown function (DUF3465)
LPLFLALFVSACFQVEAPAESTSKQPAIEIKSSTEVLEANNLSNDALVKAYQTKRSQVWVEGSGEVKKLLADDNKGSRHQKFLVTINAQQTLLFAHNIDLAPRVDDLQVGDTIEFRGEYVYNPKGGVMHWTHHDPSSRQENNSPQGEQQGGWLKHNGKKYE